MYDHHLPGAASGAVSGRAYVGPTPVPPQGAAFLYDWNVTTYQLFPKTVLDASTFPGGNPLDASVSNTSNPILSALGYETSYNPVTGTGGLSRPSDPSFLSTSFSPLS